eukprot:7380405-Prymnesium_polylepis.1
MRLLDDALPREEDQEGDTARDAPPGTKYRPPSACTRLHLVEIGFLSVELGGLGRHGHLLQEHGVLPHLVWVAREDDTRVVAGARVLDLVLLHQLDVLRLGDCCGGKGELARQKRRHAEQQDGRGQDAARRLALWAHPHEPRLIVHERHALAERDAGRVHCLREAVREGGALAFEGAHPNLGMSVAAQAALADRVPARLGKFRRDARVRIGQVEIVVQRVEALARAPLHLLAERRLEAGLLVSAHGAELFFVWQAG